MTSWEPLEKLADVVEAPGKVSKNNLTLNLAQCACCSVPFRFSVHVHSFLLEGGNILTYNFQQLLDKGPLTNEMHTEQVRDSGGQI